MGYDRVEEKQSGVRGVRYNRAGRSWEATYYEKGRQKAKSFIIAQHGDEKALQLAIEYRLAKEKSGGIKVRPAAEIRGVSYDKRLRGWVSRTSHRGQYIRRWFSLAVYGPDRAKRLAIAQTRSWQDSKSKGRSPNQIDITLIP